MFVKHNSTLAIQTLALAEAQSFEKAQEALTELLDLITAETFQEAEYISALNLLNQNIRTNVFTAIEKMDSEDEEFFNERTKAFLKARRTLMAMGHTSECHINIELLEPVMEQLEQFQNCVSAKDIQNCVAELFCCLSKPEYEFIAVPAYSFVLRSIENEIIPQYFIHMRSKAAGDNCIDNYGLFKATEYLPYGAYTLHFLILAKNGIKAIHPVDLKPSKGYSTLSDRVSSFLAAISRVPGCVASAAIESMVNILPGVMAYELCPGLTRAENRIAVNLTDLSRSMLNEEDYDNADDSLANVMDAMRALDCLDVSMDAEELKNNWAIFASDFKYCFDTADMISDYGKSTLVVNLFSSLLKNNELDEGFKLLIRFVLALAISPLRLISDDLLLIEWVMKA